METLNKLTAGFAAMGVDPRALVTPVRNQAEPPDSEPVQDSAQRRLSERIDAARDLIQQGLISRRPNAATGTDEADEE